MSTTAPSAFAMSADYIIIGGGTAGCTLAARLRQRLPSASILIVEAGPDPSRNEQVLSASEAHTVRHSDLAWQLEVAPNKGLGGRGYIAQVGKALGGSAAINGGGWTRGPASDYDYWADLVDDNGWSYKSMVPYFRMIENVHGNGRDENQHGYDGPMEVNPIKSNWPARKYPLRESIQAAWQEVGVSYKSDPNDGYPTGLTEFNECWSNGRRQLPSKIFDLSGVTILPSTLVARVTIKDVAGKLIASGVDLVDSRHITASKEVILSAGVFHSPKILNLSGIGDPKILNRHAIPVWVPNMAVGQNLCDHLSVGLTWKLRHPEKGMAMGSPLLTDPSYANGWPLDFIQFGQTDLHGLQASIDARFRSANENEFLLRPDAVHHETVVLYAPMGPRMAGIDAAMDGSHISSMAILLTPSSRGYVSINSNNPSDPPYIDVNFNATTADGFMLREATRQIAHVMLETDSGKSFIESEVVPEGYPPILPNSEDEDIDRRMRDFGFSLDHPMGTCAMAQVVDSQCRVKGIENLRVVDASIIPIPLAAHIQAAVYAIAEKAADMIVRGF